jgi:hypothetical protein
MPTYDGIYSIIHVAHAEHWTFYPSAIDEGKGVSEAEADFTVSHALSLAEL